MRYFELEPEFAGSFGPGSIFDDVRSRPPKISKFNFEFDIWSEDPILEAVSSYIVADTLRERLTTTGASGVSFGPVEITKSDIFEELHPGRDLPKFSWLQVVGKPGSDDFGMASSGLLVVSERVLELLKQAGMKHATIAEYGDNAER
jgi:hypothetical protein